MQLSSFGTFFCGQFLFVKDLSENAYLTASVLILLLNFLYVLRLCLHPLVPLPPLLLLRLLTCPFVLCLCSCFGVVWCGVGVWRALAFSVRSRTVSVL